jgi:hypothetical protein
VNPLSASYTAVSVEQSWRQGSILAATGLAAGWICATAFSLGATLDRVSSQRDASVHQGRTANAALVSYRFALDDAIAQRDLEGRTGRGPRWRQLNATVLELRGKLVGLGTEREVDSAGARIAVLSGGWITAERYHIIHPVTAPLGCFLFRIVRHPFSLCRNEDCRTHPLDVDRGPRHDYESNKPSRCLNSVGRLLVL